MNQLDEPRKNTAEQDFIKAVMYKMKRSRDLSREWREEAREHFRYIANDQWLDPEVVSKMVDELRPMVTFNRSEVFIQAITGLEALNRQEQTILPRVIGSEMAGLADMWSAALDYANDVAMADMHHSHAFRDLSICGMGWTLTRTDHDRNPDGDICVERKDPLRCYWDHRSTQRNLLDRRWCAYVEFLPMNDVKEMWPEKAADIRTGSRASIFDNEIDLYDASQGRPEIGLNDTVRGDYEIPVILYQWYEMDVYFRVALNGKTKDISAKTWNDFKKENPEFESLRAVRIKKRCYHQAFIAGNVLLERTQLASSDFSLQCMTGKHDRHKNAWYGLMRSLRSPQDWLNKFFSGILHIINSNAKGGVMAEREAFDNPQDAEMDWANPTKIVFLKKNALREGRITERKALEYPQGLDRLMQFSMEMFGEVSGISPELLGLADRLQPGVLESQRKQAGMTILSWAFDAMSGYKRTQGRVLAEYVREFIADGRLIRVAGPEGYKYVQLIKDALTPTYDIVVAEAPNSVNEKERTFAVIQQLLPIISQVTGHVPPEILDYIPIPQKLIDGWKKAMQNPPNAQAQAMAQQLQMEMGKAQLQKTQNEAQAIPVKAKADEMRGQAAMIKATE